MNACRRPGNISTERLYAVNAPQDASPPLTPGPQSDNLDPLDDL
jgi:hypothetical protein